GDILGIIPNAFLSEYKVGSAQDNKQEIAATFLCLDERMIFHFRGFVHRLAEQRILLEEFVEDLKQQEPDDLANLIYEPLLGDISSVEAGEIVIGWLFSHISGSWPSLSVRETDLDKEGNYWRVTVMLNTKISGFVKVISGFAVDRRKGIV